jgi:hypothetical protein
MRIRFVPFILILSIVLNFYLFFRKSGYSEISDEDYGCYLYPEDVSSIDHGMTPHEYFPVMKGYSISGEVTEFLDFYIRGTIVSSVKNKYNIDVPVSFVRNIQEISYFFNDFRVPFSEGDRVSVFFRKSDGAIVYMRFENSRRRSVHETFLFKDADDNEIYVVSDGSHLQPCITNGPFRGCPQVGFIMEQNILVPVFETSAASEVRLPFLAKITGTSTTSASGGEVEAIYSDHMVRAVFKGLITVNSNLKRESIYKPDVMIGKGGYLLQGDRKGVVYYLRRRDNSILSPFSFHHTEKVYVSEKRRQNLQIASNFYSRWFQSGTNFEKKYY